MEPSIFLCIQLGSLEFPTSKPCSFLELSHSFISGPSSSWTSYVLQKWHYMDMGPHSQPTKFLLAPIETSWRKEKGNKQFHLNWARVQIVFEHKWFPKEAFAISTNNTRSLWISHAKLKALPWVKTKEDQAFFFPFKFFFFKYIYIYIYIYIYVTLRDENLHPSPNELYFAKKKLNELKSHTQTYNK
jgi:hypothetical protein